jgi:hypothetical protein
MGTPLLQQIALRNNGVPLKKLRKHPRVFIVANPQWFLYNIYLIGTFL